MNSRLTFILQIAQQGLSVASSILFNQAKGFDKQAINPINSLEAQASYKESAKNYRTLANVIAACDTGITTFLTNLEDNPNI